MLNRQLMKTGCTLPCQQAVCGPVHQLKNQRFRQNLCGRHFRLPSCPGLCCYTNACRVLLAEVWSGIITYGVSPVPWSWSVTYSHPVKNIFRSLWKKGFFDLITFFDQAQKSCFCKGYFTETPLSGGDYA